MFEVKIGFDHKKVFYKSGTVVSDELAQLYPNHVKTIGSSKPKEVKKEELNLDLNNDGKFDSKDKTIAAKVLRKPSKKAKKAKK